MQIVIKISEKAYNALTHTEFDANLVVDEMRKSIVNGIPLPKGHGRLIDADAFLSKVKADREHSAYARSWTADDVLNVLNNSYAPTIIEADILESEG